MPDSAPAKMAAVSRSPVYTGNMGNTRSISRVEITMVRRDRRKKERPSVRMHKRTMGTFSSSVQTPMGMFKK